MFRSLLAGLVLTLSLSVSACTGSPTGTDTAVSESERDTGTPADCSEALSLSPESATTEAYGLVVFTGSGGSGQYTWSLSGTAHGEISESDGTYLAPSAGGVTDTVVLTDTRCGSDVSATVEVVDTLTVEPQEATVLPGASLGLAVSGGSGSYTCTLTTDASGATVGDDCSYQAGSGEGRDIIEVTDAITGDSLDVWLDVSADHRFVLWGYEGIFVPLGATFTPRATHGSGVLEIEVVEGGVSASGEAITAESAGGAQVQVTDAYTGESTTLDLVVVAPYTPPSNRDGERSTEGIAIALGDVDGDGYGDAALGFIEMSVDAWYGGAVAVYAGTSVGLEEEPSFVASSDVRQATMGRGIAAADVDDDGEVDLIVGADRGDKGGTNTGALFIYPGERGGFFDDEPSRSLYGQIAYERFGSAVAACDFDGDGWTDLAVGAIDAVDETVAYPSDDQGAIHVFWGSSAGFSDKADFLLYGVLPEGDTGWAYTENQHLGTRLAAGDLNGDGRCDLAAGAPEGGYDEDEAGLVFVYWGDETDVLTRTPQVAISGDEDSELGRRLAIGDVDGDGLEDLLVAAWKSDAGASVGGAAYLFGGSTLTAGSAIDPLTPSDADWSVLGTKDSDYVGSDVDLADLDGDGTADVIVAAYRAEDANYGQGLIYTFTDVSLDGSELTREDADDLIAGAESYDRFGQAVAGLEDGGMLALAGFSSAFGDESGAPYYVDDDGSLDLLSLPGEASGHDWGRGLDLFDIDGDGAPELLVGGPYAGDEDLGGNAGRVWAYATPYGEEEDTGTPFLGGHPDHSSADRFGYRISSAGDFDGDGYEDLAVVSHRESKPTSFDADEYNNPDDCEGYISLAGAVFVYRGSASGLETEPTFVFHGDESSAGIGQLAGGFDHDGDGYDDLLLGSTSWGGDAGGIRIVYGREASGGEGLDILCESETWDGDSDFDRFGYAVASLGDVDGDGCDDLGVGATGEEASADWQNQGIMRVFWGWGDRCDADTPQISNLAIKVIGTGLGSAIAAGGDIDGDGIDDLVVGGAEYRIYFSEVGAAWVVPGAYLQTVDRVETDAGSLVVPEDYADWDFLLPEEGLEERLGIIGEAAASLHGDSLALVQSPQDADRAWVAVGASNGDLGGTSRAGGVGLYAWDDEGDGIEDVPVMLFVGEDFGPEGELGATLHADVVDGRPVLLVGAPRSDQSGLDLGAAYVLWLDAPGG